MSKVDADFLPISSSYRERQLSVCGSNKSVAELDADYKRWIDDENNLEILPRTSGSMGARKRDWIKHRR
jgi:hypothetical protein